ncbi:hypothetical protein LINGRAPRIM_LOCUS2485 [Linum grandiflorum]
MGLFLHKSGTSHERIRKCKKPSKKTRFWIVFFWRCVQRYLYKDEKMM